MTRRWVPIFCPPNLLNFLYLSLISQKSCPKCKRACQIKERKRSKNAENKFYSWRCMKCSTYYSLYGGTFFGNFKKPLFEIFSIFKCWSVELSVSKSLAILKYQDTEVIKFHCCLIIFWANNKRYQWLKPCRHTIYTLGKSLRDIADYNLITTDLNLITQLKIKTTVI